MFDIVENPYIQIADLFVCTTCSAGATSEREMLGHLAHVHGIHKATEEQLKERDEWRRNTQK